MTLAAVLRHLAFAVGLALLSATVVRAMIAARVPDRPDPRNVHAQDTPRAAGLAWWRRSSPASPCSTALPSSPDCYFVGVIEASVAIAIVAFLGACPFHVGQDVPKLSIMPRLLAKVPQANRPPRQAKPGVPPGRGATKGAEGQQPFVPTHVQRAQVMKYVACGFNHDSISVVMAIPVKKFGRHFEWELNHGKTMVDARILGGIVEQAFEGDRTMAIFYAKARGGWRERGSDDQGTDASPVFTINISHDSPSTPDTGHRISISALPLQPEEEP